MGAATDGAEIVRLAKEHAELKPVVDAVQALERARGEAPELEEMAGGGDAEMAAMARDELEALNDRLPDLEREVALLLAPKDKDENASAILEVRAGTGGDEAALFAGDLFRMYQRYAAEPRLAGRDRQRLRGRGRRLQGNHRLGHRRRRVRPAEVRERRPPRAAGARPPRRRGASTPPPPPSPSCPRPRTSRSRSTTATSASTPTARPAPAASTSTRPTRPCASPTCPPASW